MLACLLLHTHTLVRMLFHSQTTYACILLTRHKLRRNMRRLIQRLTIVLCTISMHIMGTQRGRAKENVCISSQWVQGIIYVNYENISISNLAFLKPREVNLDTRNEFQQRQELGIRGTNFGIAAALTYLSRSPWAWIRQEGVYNYSSGNSRLKEKKNSKLMRVCVLNPSPSLGIFSCTLFLSKLSEIVKGRREFFFYPILLLLFCNCNCKLCIFSYVRVHIDPLVR